MKLMVWGYKLNCGKFLIAVRKNPLSKSATQLEVKRVIKVWLRSTPDREELIIVAVRRNPLTQNVAQQEVESIIKLWLTNGGFEMVEDCVG
ncbi:hypothetical protein RN001_008614 [Aquatica leii]|uniref:Uncharacterized protein n=1 Tax=Aquatica leii TaxID=1421715 RepID=A0AAN7SPB0_9COLE|nr:hypothetical protein RN001_008614 [Aquatica leii]